MAKSKNFLPELTHQIDVLVLDELGYISASKTDNELFFDIISQALAGTF